MAIDGYNEDQMVMKELTREISYMIYVSIPQKKGSNKLTKEAFWPIRKDKKEVAAKPTKKQLEEAREKIKGYGK